MAQLKFAVREHMAPGRTIREKFENLARIGLSGIEIVASSTPECFEEIRSAKEATGIVPAIWSVREGAILDARKPERDKFVKAIKEVLEMCGALGGVGVIVVPLLPIKMGGRPRIPDLSPWKSQSELERELLITILKELAPHAVQHNSCIIVEPLNRYEQWFPNRVEQGVAICKAVGSVGVATMADFFHMNIEEADMVAAIRCGGKYIRHVHLADSNRWLPGYGHTNFAPAINALREIGYDGFYGFECHIPGDPFEELPKAMRYIEDCLA